MGGGRHLGVRSAPRDERVFFKTETGFPFPSLILRKFRDKPAISY